MWWLLFVVLVFDCYVVAWLVAVFCMVICRFGVCLV